MNDLDDITVILKSLPLNAPETLNKLMPLLHDELRQIATSAFETSAGDQTLQATALVHEAYIKLLDSDAQFQNRAEFLASAASMMRKILVDNARAKARQKHGGDVTVLSWNEVAQHADETSSNVLELEMVLNKLHKIDARKAKAIELSFFAGMTYDEIGLTLGISPATVDRELRFARAWLMKEMKADASDTSDRTFY
jgi:RNA polymerase sigma factor (TIGR02999 family)